MPNARGVIDVTNEPELRRLAEDVRGTGEPQILRRGGEDLAVVVPMAPGQEIGARRAKTTEDLPAYRAAADSWREVDLKTSLRNNAVSRTRTTRMPRS